MPPRVSVISPMYNVSAYVEECLQSLLDQEFADFEAIFVDDGSTDNTLERAQVYVQGDARFTFLPQEHGGQSVARNRALEQATGEFVLFLDSDDAYVPQTIARLMEVRDQLDLDAVFFTAKMNYEKRDLVYTHYESHINRVGEDEVVNGFEMMTHFHQTDSFRPSACMYLFRRSLIDEVGLRFYEGIIHEDLLFTLSFFPLVKRCVFLSEPLYIRRMRHGSTMTKPRSIENVHGLFTITRELEKQIEEHKHNWPLDYIDALCNRVADTWNNLAKDAVNLGEDALRVYRDALSIEDRISFNLHVLEAGHFRDELQNFYAQSTSYKLGGALLAVPCWIKDRFVKTPE